MALIDRIFHDPAFEPRITNHAFSAAIWLHVSNNTDYARAKIINDFDITTAEEPELDEIIAHYDTLTPAAKRAYHSDVEAAGVLAEEGLIVQGKYKQLLGLS